MRFLDNIRRVKALYDAGPDAHLGDIAVLKIDAFGLDVRPGLRAELDGVRGYLPEVDLDALAALPAGTFGHALAHFMRSQGLSPFTLSDEIDADMRARNAFGIRWSTTHDMLHTLLGFDASWPGEIGVLAFTTAQGWTPFLWFQLLTAWLVYPFWSGFQIGALWRATRRGLAMGRRARFVLPVRLEERFHLPIADVRAELGIAEAPAMPVSTAIAA